MDASDPRPTQTAAAEAAGLPQFALRDADSFLVADAVGDITGGSDGFFCNDTRLLSRLQLSLAGTRPALLSSAVSRDNVFFTAHFSNRPQSPLEEADLPRNALHLERSRFLWQNRLYERLCLRNFAEREAGLLLQLHLEADFRDIFEVRGAMRRERGRSEPPQLDGAVLRFRYHGLDGVTRSSEAAFSETPLRFEGGRLQFALTVPAAGEAVLYVEIAEQAEDRPGRERYRRAAALARTAMRRRRRQGATVRTSSRLFNEWIEKSRADLALLTTDLPTGPYPYAGVPWFSTPFGRDAIVTALQTLWVDPRLARGVLAYLAQHQAQHQSSFQDSAPGKIMHETRKGEMATLRELPFERYYGGVDTTPLFVMLAGAYLRRSGDAAFVDSLWPALTAAMRWIESVCDAHPLGLLDYARGEASGLANQGWKDSGDSVFHADGTLAQAPIALVEVQGYVYAALRTMARLARLRGERAYAQSCERRLERLRSTVESKFWMEHRGSYGIALDGRGALCEVLTTNAGHLLYSGLPEPSRASRVIEQLLSPRSNSGWGLRTVTAGQSRFNPMAYHNGSVWPHDTALCAAGMARYGERDGVVRLLDELFEAAVHCGMRLPELFCGFARRAGEPPVAYPVACLPQAWAAGSVFMLLQACLGVAVDGERGEIRIDRPRLPSGVERLVLRDLAVRDERVSLRFQRVGRRVTVARESPAGAVRVVCSL